MTLQQEAYNRIDQMTEDGIRILIEMIDAMRTVSITGFKEPMMKSQVVNKVAGLTKEEKKKRFLQSAGKIQIDATAVNDLRERSMI